jgi:hypothetical protein
MVVIFAIVFGNAIDRSIDNQNRMLCESAKVSGNQEYQLKCKVYYTTGSIKELR